MKKLAGNICEAIGETPMVELSRIVEHYGAQGRIFAKLEYLNPGFSKKDRIALEMIVEAERSGALKPGQTVVELTSGNTGTGLAIVCRATGHPFVACMSEGNSVERARMMRALGAEVVLVRQTQADVKGQVSGGDLDLVEREAERIVRERDGFRADQFKLASAVSAHRLHTAPEMWEQTGGQIQVFADILGSGGTFVGCATALKQLDPTIHCYVVEPENAAIYAGHPPINNGHHKIQGCGYNRILTWMDGQLADGYLQITDGEAIESARDLARLEGIFAGFSSGANVRAAIKLLSGPERGKNIAVVANDSGLKYLSTDLYE